MPGNADTNKERWLDRHIINVVPHFHGRSLDLWIKFQDARQEVDPLECPRCGREMKMIALIDDGQVIEKILRHLDLWSQQRLPVRGPPRAALAEYVHEPFFEDVPVLITGR